MSRLAGEISSVMADHRAPARGKPITYAQLEASYRACTEGTERERVRVAFNEGKMYFRDPVTGDRKSVV